MKKCNFCGSNDYEERKTEYLYSHKGQYLLVPETPCEVCLNCGMVYYHANVLNEIERQFFSIQNKEEEPDRYLRVPERVFVQST